MTRFLTGTLIGGLAAFALTLSLGATPLQAQQNSGPRLSPKQIQGIVPANRIQPHPSEWHSGPPADLSQPSGDPAKDAVHQYFLWSLLQPVGEHSQFPLR